jgi:hypothetical protein
MGHPAAVRGPRNEPGMSRRGALGALGAARRALFLNEAVAQEQNPAAQVGDTAWASRGLILLLVTPRLPRSRREPRLRREWPL